MVKVKSVFFSPRQEVKSPNATQSVRQFICLSSSLICVRRNMRVRDQEDLFLSKARPKITPSANSCAWGLCVCTVTTIRTGMKGFCLSQVLQRSSSVQSRWVDFKNKKKNLCVVDGAASPTSPATN